MRNVCKQRRARAYRNSGEHPAFPAQWLYGLYVVALVTGFLATIDRRQHRGVGPPRLHRTQQRRSSSPPSRPPLPEPCDQTIMMRPLVGRDARSCAVDLPDVANTSDSCAEADSFVGWAKRKRAMTIMDDSWWARRKSAFAHPTVLILRSREAASRRMATGHMVRDGAARLLTMRN
jgi:hypothetical protein